MQSCKNVSGLSHIIYDICIVGKKITYGSRKKKVLFLVARPLRPLTPSPSPYVAIGTFFLTLKKVLFLRSTPVQPPPPFRGPATKKELLFCGFPHCLHRLAKSKTRIQSAELRKQQSRYISILHYSLVQLIFRGFS